MSLHHLGDSSTTKQVYHHGFQYSLLWLCIIYSPLYRNSYVAGVPLLGRIMKNHEAHPFRNYCIVHNGFLSVASLVLFTVLGNVVLQAYREHGLYYIICSRSMHENGVYAIAIYANYLLKYYELIDTFLIVLKKKPVDGLHFYHHAATLFLTYTQQVYHSSVQWVPILINLFVYIDI